MLLQDENFTANLQKAGIGNPYSHGREILHIISPCINPIKEDNTLRI
jgi:hypothetical protein